jgi:sec-independent protein translocase protein TatA
MLNIGPQELLVILVIALIVVGPQRLPALGRSIGRGLRELRKAQDEVKRTIQVNLDDEPPNGSSGSPAPRPGAATGSVVGRATDPKPAASESAPPDATPTASEPLPADEIRDISRSLGRSLAELRRAKEEVQRSFRIDVAPTTKPSTSKRAQQATPAPATAPADATEPSEAPADATERSEAPAKRDAVPTPEPSPDGQPATSDRPTD